MPEKYRCLLVHPLDDFIEAVIEGPDDPEVLDKVIDVIMEEVDTVVWRHGGICTECSPAGDYDGRALLHHSPGRDP